MNNFNKLIPDNEDKLNIITGLLKTLSHPMRLKILCDLSIGPKTVTDLESSTSSSQSQVSQFLSRMKNEQLVESERVGHNIFYRIKDTKVIQLIRSMNKIFC